MCALAYIVLLKPLMIVLYLELLPIVLPEPAIIDDKSEFLLILFLKPPKIC